MNDGAADRSAPRERKLGLAKGQIRVADDFDDPLPDDLLKAFYGLEPEEPWPDHLKDLPG